MLTWEWEFHLLVYAAENAFDVAKHLAPSFLID
jgi:hypothetical protein